MKITEAKIRQVIKEEIQIIIKEMYDYDEPTQPYDMEPVAEVTPTEQETKDFANKLLAAATAGGTAWMAFVTYCNEHPELASAIKHGLQAAGHVFGTNVHESKKTK
jgi:hypothetical protein